MAPLEFDVRRSDAPAIDCVWRCRSSDGGDLVSVASSHWHLVIGTSNGRTDVSVHGPETGAVRGPLPPESEWVGIRFGLGVTLQGLPMHRLVNESLPLPGVGQRSFGWKGTAWRLPTYANVEGLTERLTREGLLFGRTVTRRHHTVPGRPRTRLRRPAASEPIAAPLPRPHPGPDLRSRSVRTDVTFVQDRCRRSPYRGL